MKWCRSVINKEKRFRHKEDTLRMPKMCLIGVLKGKG